MPKFLGEIRPDIDPERRRLILPGRAADSPKPWPLVR
jgi:hypothetical protein